MDNKKDMPEIQTENPITHENREPFNDVMLTPTYN
jgi:hypothetical protein